MKIRTNLFIAEKGGLTFTSFLLLLGFPLLLSGQLLWGGFSIVLALAIGASELFTNESDKLEIRFNILTPEALITELEQLPKIEINDEEKRIEYYVEGLSALGRKYNNSNRSDRKDDKLSLLYQQISYTTIRLYPENDQIVAGSISLLALIAGNKSVRRRFKYQKEDYGLDKPIIVLKKALIRAKKEKDETKEELLAEILRKGCLFLGAACNNDEGGLHLSSIIVSEGGLELILETGNWFRLHEDVSNWVLWAIFTLCYDQIFIKLRLIKAQGIQTICTLIENNRTSLECNRHGIALLFDLLRENQSTEGIEWDPWEVRKIALSSGLHKIVLSAMDEFNDSVDIMMMGQEMLIGTGFRGNIPIHQPI
ncbi:hypothetical protein FRACYDRAFT_244675 [Fragilariopsis cylindrus CCMP1102]|uniref:ARM repeat-containing protein n=1 Tax=Fragilariopsis cylindrus CCMP1102 TaxID=635003 RepID=A0A1E7F2I1_9STRA|nr:hypothetical protein FRACYDRAFT_244675 [Fragilariopsis cylindrus CCMP1102]|eukprot:OEU12408.1 hypothetical protein FRACYDRAFT_244675 [Fragilariopsis cylindrus CCMP1102]